jgi:uncharacterized membrane protein
MENNVSNPERWLSVVGGAAALTYGLTRRSLGGFVTAALGSALIYRGATGSCPAYSALGFSTAADELPRNVSVPYGDGYRIEQAVVVDASPADLHWAWRNFKNVPRFMNSAEIINEVPNELIGWRSIDSARHRHAGSVHFTPTDRGTEVRVIILCDTEPGVGPQREVAEGLHAFKRGAETGANSSRSRESVTRETAAEPRGL